MPGKKNLSLVTLGHVDSGKSTIVGNLLFQSGQIDRRTLEKIQEEASQFGKRSYKYAFLLDKHIEERQRGITIHPHYAQLPLPQCLYQIIDTPGHVDFINNAVRASSMGDLGLLVVSAIKEELEAGMHQTNGWCKMLATIAFAQGIKQLVVCVNKLDHKSISFQQSKYNDLETKLKNMLSRIGYSEQYLTFVPVSGLEGDNIKERGRNLTWYKGPTLMQALDAALVPIRNNDGYLRMTVIEAYQIGGVGTVAAGQIKQGTLTVGQQIKILPGDIRCEVKSIESNHQLKKVAQAGDIVGVNVKGVSISDIPRGSVIGELRNMPETCTSFTAFVIIINHPTCVKKGYKLVCNIHSASVIVRFNNILSKVDRNTGQVLEEEPKSLKPGECGMVQFYPDKPMVVEDFAEVPDLGRFVLRDQRTVVGVGVVAKANKGVYQKPTPQAKESKPRARDAPAGRRGNARSRARGGRR